MKTLKYSIVVAALSLATSASAAITPDDDEWPTSYPAWWYDAENPASGFVDVTQPTLNEGNESLLSIGQLKHIVSKAHEELNVSLKSIGGAGTEIDALIESFVTNSSDNLSPVAVGQLKYVSSKFYDRFLEIGYQPDSAGWNSDIILDEGTGDNSPLYPWLNDITPENSDLANVGQAKYLFSWDLAAFTSVDSDGDDLSDAWEMYWFNSLSQSDNSDPDRDGISNLNEYLNGTNPMDNAFFVTFDLGNKGTLLSGDLVQIVVGGGTVIAPTVRVSSGYTFTGWDVSYHDVMSDLTVTAQYTDESLASILERKVLASDPASDDRFGRFVSIDGDTAIIGAIHNDDNNGSNSGSAYIYVRDGDNWVEQQKLTASDGTTSDWFGSAVSISGDTVVVGAYGNDDSGSNSGSAYVFVRNNGVWAEQAKLVAGDSAAEDWFSFNVSIYKDTIVIGAYKDDDDGTDSGSAYVFTRSAGVWNQHQKLTASDAAAGDLFGFAPIVHENTIIIGGHRNDDNGADSGSAYVFVYDGTSWVEQQKLVASDAAGGDTFGTRISISGNVALISAVRNDDNGTDSGSVYVFKHDGTSWVEQQKLVASDAAGGDWFGNRIGISGDIALIGAVYNDDDGTSSGSAYVFKYDGISWMEQQKLTASDAVAEDRFGNSIGLSGNTALIGAYYNDDNGTDSGSAYFYDLGVDDSDSDGDGYTAAQEASMGTDSNMFDSSVLGFVLVEEWHGITGTTIASLTSSTSYKDSPSNWYSSTDLDFPVNQRDNYGVRVKGYIVPDMTGEYYFQMASDDNGEFWLSTDDRPDSKVLMASVSGATTYQEWAKYPSQTSTTITLTTGEYYYFELYMKEGTSGDHLSLRWNKPNGSFEILQSANLATFSTLDTDRDFILDAIEQTIVDVNESDSLDSIWHVHPQDDYDLDGLSNLQEFKLNLSLIDSDTDRDGFNDKYELLLGSDPTDSRSVPFDPTAPFGDLDGDQLANDLENTINTDRNFYETVDSIKSNADFGTIGRIYINIIGRGIFEINENNEAINIE